MKQETKQELKAQLEVLAAQIGRAELMRGIGKYFSARELFHLKQTFRSLSRRYLRGGR